MKKYFSIIPILIVISFTACTTKEVKTDSPSTTHQASPSATTTSAAKASLTASATASASAQNTTVLTYKARSDWATYTDTKEKISLQYPKNYIKSDPAPENGGVSFTSCLNDSKGNRICHTEMLINVFNDYTGGPRRVWLSNKYGAPYRPYYEDVTIAGIRSLIVMDGNTGGSTGSEILIPKGTKMYMIAFTTGWNPDKPSDKTQLNFMKQVGATFKFL